MQMDIGRVYIDTNAWNALRGMVANEAHVTALVGRVISRYREGDWGHSSRTDARLNDVLTKGPTLLFQPHWIIAAYRVRCINLEIATDPDRRQTVIRLATARCRRSRRNCPVVNT